MRQLHQERKSRQGVRPSALPSFARNYQLHLYPFIESFNLLRVSNDPALKGRGFVMRKVRSQKFAVLKGHEFTRAVNAAN